MFSGQRRLALACFLATAMLTVACGDDPPQTEMQQAQSAIDAARAAGADEYAHDELAAAEGALARARTAVERARLPAGAQPLARQPRARADRRERKPPARRRPHASTPSVRSQTAAATIAEARSRLKAAQTGGAPARRLAAARRSIAAGDQARAKSARSVRSGQLPERAAGIERADHAFGGRITRFGGGATRRRHARPR